MVSSPYYSYIFRDSYGSGMGIVWETYHQGVPFLGVPENLTDLGWTAELGAALHIISGNEGWSQVKGWWNPEKTWSIHNHNTCKYTCNVFECCRNMNHELLQLSPNNTSFIMTPTLSTLTTSSLPPLTFALLPSKDLRHTASGDFELRKVVWIPWMF